MRRVWALIFVAVLLSACSNTRSSVTAFHRLTPDVIQGKTLAIEAFPPERQASLEFATYRDALATRFAKQGLVVVDNAKDAEWLAVVSYGIDGGRVGSESYSVPQYGLVGGGTTYHSGSVSSSRGGSGTYSGTSYTPPSYGLTGYSNGTRSYTEYTRELSIDILDRAALDRGQTIKLYEAKAISADYCGVFAAVFDNMSEALFRDWPGESGKTRSIMINGPKRQC